jgi:hypothetical protein
VATGTVKWFNATKGFGLYNPTTAAKTYLCTSHGRGKSRPEQPQRGCKGELRGDGEPRQNVRGKSKSWLKALCIKPAGSRRRFFSGT